MRYMVATDAFASNAACWYQSRALPTTATFIVVPNTLSVRPAPDVISSLSALPSNYSTKAVSLCRVVEISHQPEDDTTNLGCRASPVWVI